MLNLKMAQICKILGRIILTVCSVYAFNAWVFGTYTIGFNNILLATFVFIATFLLGKKLPKAKSEETAKRVKQMSVIGAVITAVVFLIANSLYRDTSLDLILGSHSALFSSFIFAIGVFYILFLLLTRSLRWFAEHDFMPPLKNEFKFFGDNQRSFFVIWIILFVFWVPVWLAFYPGVYTYDIGPQISAMSGWLYFNAFYPVLHTVFAGGINRIAMALGFSFHEEIAVYSVIHMLLMSAAYSYAVRRMAGIGVDFRLRMIMLTFFALYPVNAMFSFSTATDALFAAAFIHILISVIEISMDKQITKYPFVHLCIWLFISCFLRNNQVYAVIIATIIIALIYKGRRRKDLVVSFCAVAVTTLMIIHPIYGILGIKTDGMRREPFSIPIQQLAFVVKNHFQEFSDDIHLRLGTVFKINIVERYNPRFSDPVKIVTLINRNFFALWGKFLIAYPKEYVEAGLNLNLGYWHPDAAYPGQYGGFIYLEDFITGGEQSPVLPGLFHEIHGFNTNNAKWAFLPILRSLGSVGMPIWVMLFSVAVCFVRKNTHLIAAIVPGLCLWLTYLAGPVSNLRYIYPIIACYPVFAAVICMQTALERDTIRKRASVKWGGVCELAIFISAYLAACVFNEVLFGADNNDFKGGLTGLFVFGTLAWGMCEFIESRRNGHEKNAVE